MAAARTKPAPAAVRRSIAAIDRLVAERMRGRRLMLGMTQLNLARAVGVSYQQLNKYETGENRISVGKLHQIAQVLGVEMSYFFEPIEAERSPFSSTEQRLPRQAMSASCKLVTPNSRIVPGT
jgi:transcriptional regulator with XRE-family HTH domain